MLDPRLGICLWALRAAFSVVPFASGLRQLHAAGPLGLVRGLIELTAGILILTPLTLQAAHLLAGWLLVLALHGVLTRARLDLACADVVLAAGAFALARLTGVNEAEPAAGRPLGSACAREGACGGDRIER